MAKKTNVIGDAAHRRAVISISAISKALCVPGSAPGVRRVRTFLLYCGLAFPDHSQPRSDGHKEASPTRQSTTGVRSRPGEIRDLSSIGCQGACGAASASFDGHSGRLGRAGATYKEKRDLVTDNNEQVSYGLLGYPVLQTADILLYRAHAVPVGEIRPRTWRSPARSPRRFNRLTGTDSFRNRTPISAR